MGNKTFAIIKPDAVKAGNTGKIYDRIIQAGFHITVSYTHLTLPTNGEV